MGADLVNPLYTIAHATLAIIQAIPDAVTSCLQLL